MLYLWQYLFLCFDKYTLFYPFKDSLIHLYEFHLFINWSITLSSDIQSFWIFSLAQTVPTIDLKIILYCLLIIYWEFMLFMMLSRRVLCVFFFFFHIGRQWSNTFYCIVGHFPNDVKCYSMINYNSTYT